MKLSELIEKVGDDNVTFQTLPTDMDSCNVYARDGRVTFFTSRQMVLDMLKEEPEYIGLVIWIPKALMPEMPEMTVSAGDK